MKSVQVVAQGKAQFVDQPKPKIKPGFALIRTSHLSLCGSDIRMLHHADPKLYPFPPGTTGHEMVGVVEEVADGNLPFSVGDRVLALAPDHRAMAEYYLAPVQFVLPLPEGPPIEVLLQAQQFGTVLYAAQRLPNLVGKHVVVIGQGSAGLWFNHVLERLGARAIVAVDHDESRLKYAKQFGATQVIHHGTDESSPQDTAGKLAELLNGQLADLVVEAAGEIDAINLALHLVRKFGDIMYFGYPRGQKMNFDFELFFHKCCRATTIVGATEESNQESTRMAIEMIHRDPSLAATLITHRLKFGEVLSAYDMHRTRGDDCLKIVIETQ